MNIEAALLNVVLFWILTTPHEYAHAWVATKLGDDTPTLEGRVTLNPMAHVDWLGTVILPAITSLLGAGFLGWGRPVNCNPNRLRGGLKGLAVVAMAGPASNVLFALVLSALAVGVYRFSPSLATLAYNAVQLSLYLAIFNLLPVPPLDGSKLLLALNVPPAVYLELARFGFLLLLVAMSATNLGLWMHNWSVTGTDQMVNLFR
ncbi:MAG: site-2 protease family protein [Acidobacteria bacterium]|nr:site-2 protease family protein [Acidobacteriota bacterium]